MSAPIREELELRDRVEDHIRSERRDDAALDDLAGDIFRFQRGACPAYARWCDLQSVLNETVRGVADVPGLPQEAWKCLRVSAVDPDRIARSFRSSGTTGTARSVQRLPDTGLYDLALELGFTKSLLADGVCRHIHALLPSPAAAPESSLVYMVERVASARGLPVPEWFVEGEALDVPRVESGLRAATEPVLVVGTAFSFLLLSDALEARPLALPAGSRVMETGGFKGRSREVTRPELHAAIERTLGVPPRRICNQYGMCETSTQFYDSMEPDRAKSVPPWARVTIVDPRAQLPAEVGEAGMIQIYDPANLYTCAAILTADIGRALPDERFEVIGRAGAAEPRGCSLMLADLDRGA